MAIGPRSDPSLRFIMRAYTKSDGQRILLPPTEVYATLAHSLYGLFMDLGLDAFEEDIWTLAWETAKWIIEQVGLKWIDPQKEEEHK